MERTKGRTSSVLMDKSMDSEKKNMFKRKGTVEDIEGKDKETA